MSYVDELLDRAFKSAVSKIWADARPKNKHKKRVRNRNKLYKIRLQSGMVKRIKKGGR
ncbi:hypothetical protein [Clostridium botulinum]|uniref:hypothetical protein n=1 Tax=Clostridium botulinum TaxID=1491 RepID=UPI001C9B37D5|nr:hypothetical protein [Clostridium botulinum]MBY6755498.1 hypothetical protein [Clostridium botulinum]MBY6766425.1 hypothetical protein [Clostridium botulinum]MBY6900371.1 hypothetical protein [Clostridium botulinum]MBY6914630.1 hypothetical protein [Clostridium botulinum]